VLEISVPEALTSEGIKMRFNDHDHVSVLEISLFLRSQQPLVCGSFSGRVDKVYITRSVMLEHIPEIGVWDTKVSFRQSRVWKFQ